MWGGYQVREQRELQSIVSKMTKNKPKVRLVKKRKIKKGLSGTSIGLSVDLINHKEELPKQQNYTMSAYSSRLSGVGIMAEFSPKDKGHYWGAHLAWRATAFERSRARFRLATSLGLRQEKLVKKIDVSSSEGLETKRYAILGLSLIHI